MSSAADAAEPPAPHIYTSPPLLTRLNYACFTWLLKSIGKLATFYISTAATVLKVTRKPTYTKVYPVRPMIKNRVFIPNTYKAGDRPLPLYIDIHGSGFTFFDPSFDDDICYYLAQKHGLCVVSIGHRQAPIHPFPTPVEDCAAVVMAILADKDLPCDTSKVAIGGYSAGANLALACSQVEGLKGRIGGVVAFWPPTNFTRTVESKLRGRPYVDGKKDNLQQIAYWMNWAYIPQGTDLTNPLLSVIYARKEDLPPKLCFFGCEFDMFCQEAEDMAGRLAETGERVMLGKGSGWEKGNVRWEKMLGREHGFDHWPVWSNEVKETEDHKIGREMHDNAAAWLFRMVYA
jgi:acetyl esterase/lipase